jgi:hypothetical protein
MTMEMTKKLVFVHGIENEVYGYALLDRSPFLGDQDQPIPPHPGAVFAQLFVPAHGYLNARLMDQMCSGEIGICGAFHPGVETIELNDIIEDHYAELRVVNAAMQAERKKGAMYGGAIALGVLRAKKREYVYLPYAHDELLHERWVGNKVLDFPHIGKTRVAKECNDSSFNYLEEGFEFWRDNLPWAIRDISLAEHKLRKAGVYPMSSEEEGGESSSEEEEEEPNVIDLVSEEEEEEEEPNVIDLVSEEEEEEEEEKKPKRAKIEEEEEEEEPVIIEAQDVPMVFEKFNEMLADHHKRMRMDGLEKFELNEKLSSLNYLFVEGY